VRRVARGADVAKCQATSGVRLWSKLQIAARTEPSEFEDVEEKVP
jgi:hypothetical protein